MSMSINSKKNHAIRKMDALQCKKDGELPKALLQPTDTGDRSIQGTPKELHVMVL